MCWFTGSACLCLTTLWVRDQINFPYGDIYIYIYIYIYMYVYTFSRDWLDELEDAF